MDTFSHALWGKGLFGYRKYRPLSIFFGLFPDLSSFGVLFIVKIISDPYNYKFGKPSLEELPYWVFNLYDFSHSLLIASIFLIITYFINKDIFFPMLAWPFHILLDIFTHSVAFFPTPIFWPLLDYKFDGIPWSNPYIWFSNIAGIILIFLYRRKYKSI